MFTYRGGKENVTSITETNILFVGTGVLDCPLSTPTANFISVAKTNTNICVGGDVLDAPFKTITANLTFARQGNAATKPSP